MDKLAGQVLIEKLTDRFANFESGLNGQSKTALHQVRRNAFASLQANGFPTAKNEKYKFTNLTKALEKNIDFGQKPEAGSLTAAEIEAVKIDGLDALSLVFVNGVFSEENSDDISGAGFTIKTFEDAAKNDLSLLENHFGQYASFENDAFVALNSDRGSKR